jgi:hypothetical protein
MFRTHGAALHDAVVRHDSTARYEFKVADKHRISYLAAGCESPGMTAPPTTLAVPTTTSVATPTAVLATDTVADPTATAAEPTAVPTATTAQPDNAITSDSNKSIRIEGPVSRYRS